MIGVVGVGDVTACLESVEAMPQVEKVVRISAPYKFVSKEFRPGKTRIKSGRRRGNWRRRVRGDGRAVLGGIRRTDYAYGGSGGEDGGEIIARRRVQAADFALRFSGHGRRRVEAAGEGEEGDRAWEL